MRCSVVSGNRDGGTKGVDAGGKARSASRDKLRFKGLEASVAAGPGAAAARHQPGIAVQHHPVGRGADAPQQGALGVGRVLQHGQGLRRVAGNHHRVVAGGVAVAIAQMHMVGVAAQPGHAAA